MNKIEQEINKYGLLRDGTIVKIGMWERAEGPNQEIFFTYGLLYRLTHKRKTAFAFRKDFKAFSESKRALKKYWLSEEDVWRFWYVGKIKSDRMQEDVWQLWYVGKIKIGWVKKT